MFPCFLMCFYEGNSVLHEAAVVSPVRVRERPPAFAEPTAGRPANCNRRLRELWTMKARPRRLPAVGLAEVGRMFAYRTAHALSHHRDRIAEPTAGRPANCNRRLRELWTMKARPRRLPAVGLAEVGRMFAYRSAHALSHHRDRVAEPTAGRPATAGPPCTRRRYRMLSGGGFDYGACSGLPAQIEQLRQR